MANEYYDPTGNPQTGARGNSAMQRNENNLIKQGFDKLPTLSGKGNKAAKVNASGTALEASEVISDDGTDATVSGDLTVTGDIKNTALDDDLTALQNDIDTRATSAELTAHIDDTADAHNASAIKNTPSGNLAATNVQTALNELQTDVDTRLTPSGTETLTNKTIDLADNTVTMTFAEFNAAVSDVDLSALYKPSVNATIYSDFTKNEHYLYEPPTGRVAKAQTDIWTVTRGSSAKFTDPTGLTRTADVNVPTITYDNLTGECLGLKVEETRANEFVHPRNFNLSSWTKTNSNITGYKWFETGLIGYKVSEDTTTSSHDLNQSVTYTTGKKKTLTYLVYPDGRTTLRVQLGTGAGAFSVLQQAEFETTTLSATVTSGTGSASIKTLNGGLFLLIFTTDTATSTQAMNTFLSFKLGGVVSYTGDGVSGAYFLHAQAEDGASATSLIPPADTFTSRADQGSYVDANGDVQVVAVDVERFTYDPANLRAEPVPLYEVASSNALANRDVMATETVAVTNGQVYTLSFDGTGSVQLSGADTTNVVGLGTGLANQQSFTFTAASTSLTLTVTGSCLRGQLEPLAYATSRITDAMTSGTRAADITTGVQASRDTDNVEKTLGDEFNPNNFGIYFESKMPYDNSANSIRDWFRLDNGSNVGAGGLLFWAWSGGDGRRIYGYDATGSLVTNISATTSNGFPSNDEFAKCYIGISSGNLTFIINGVLAGKYTGGDVVVPQIPVLDLCGRGNTRTKFYKEVRVLPRDITEAEAVALTTP